MALKLRKNVYYIADQKYNFSMSEEVNFHCIIYIKLYIYRKQKII